MRGNDCWQQGGLLGLYFGGMAGGFIGWFAGGWLGAIGFALAGAGVGLVVGMGIGWFACWLYETFGGGGGGPSFEKPRFSNLRLEASPSPARVGQPCRITLHINVDDNDDNALCEIEWHIFATDGNPPESPQNSRFGNNGSAFGRAVSFQTTWAAPHDAKPVTASVVLFASKGTDTYRFTENPMPIQVTVLP